MVLMMRRRRWTVLTLAIVVVMFVFNVLFIVDLSINHHQALHGSIDGLMGTPVGVVGGEAEEDKEEARVTQFLSVKVLSSKELVTVTVGDNEVYRSKESDRGIHVVVLNQANANLMAAKVFDTYTPVASDALVTFVNSVSDGRVLCFAVQDEGSFSLGNNGRNILKALGSRLIATLSWRDMWVLMVTKGGKVVGEDVGKAVDVQSWGTPVTLHVTIPLVNSAIECDWPKSPENERRREFCSQYEGYGALCHCSNPLTLTIKPPELKGSRVAGIPVTVIASNRPQYLFRMLRRILSAHGANASLITVFIDGFFQQPVDVAKLFGIRAVQHEPKSQKNGRISQHYKTSLSQTFDLFPEAKYTIVIEEDLDVSLDFFSYFSQSIYLLEEDPSVYCISAWNDQGYDHSCQDPSLLYRVETMPGLGWVLKRTLFKEELEPNWPGPDKLWDWDMWMRLDSIRKGRECIIPDVSRTYHFGSTGLNMNPYFQKHYFNKHTLNSDPDVRLQDVDSLKKNEYELVIHRLFREARVLDHSKDPCGKDFIPNTKGKIYVLYITMEKQNHYEHWMKLATCFHLWDLDARGFHKGLWRFWLNGNHILVVGHPFSPYSDKYKPNGIAPLSLAKSEN